MVFEQSTVYKANAILNEGHSQDLECEAVRTKGGFGIGTSSRVRRLSLWWVVRCRPAKPLKLIFCLFCIFIIKWPKV